MPLTALQEFLKLESAGGLILVFMMFAALALANSPLAAAYEALLGLPMAIQLGPLAIHKPLLLWINDGLMAIFFLHVSLEIKREILEGELSSLRQIALPTLAAVGGMAVPAAIYLAFTLGDAETYRGWAIPSATDIAFSLGILSLLGRRVPVSLKVFLTALAILDDLGAIVIIAIFYSHDLAMTPLMLAGFALVGLLVLNWFGVTRFSPFVLVALFLWVTVLKSGVHATLAGVALGFAVPLRVPGPPGHSPARQMEHALLPWVAFGILPLFALANAGVPLGGVDVDTLTHPVFLGIALGLFVGKQIGVFAFGAATIRLGLARLPEGATWMQLYGVSMLCGIGFTMSLFIGSLAFPPGYADVEIRLGVLVGSAASAIIGYALLRLSPVARLAPASVRLPEPAQQMSRREDESAARRAR